MAEQLRVGQDSLIRIGNVLHLLHLSPSTYLTSVILSHPVVLGNRQTTIHTHAADY